MKKTSPHNLILSLIAVAWLNSESHAQHANARPFMRGKHISTTTSQTSQANSTTASSLQTVRCLGGSGDEGNFSNFMTQTADGGFITCSYSSSTDGDVVATYGGVDAWVIKFNASGSIQWKKIYGGSNDDFANRIIQTTDGGYMMIGYTYSNDGYVSGNHGEGDLWLVKLSANGNVAWQKCYGGSGDEFVYYGIIQTSDGGYATICSSTSNNGNANGNHGGYDVLVLKISANGNVQWSKTYGGTQDEYGNLIVQNKDGTFTISADTYSTNGNINGNHGALDTWVARLNSNGAIMWSKCLGGTFEEYNASLVATRDGNILIGDYAGSNDGDVIGNHGVIPNGGDMWLVKLDVANGNFIWTKTLGGGNGGPRPSLPDYPDDEVALFINELPTGELLIAGGATSSDGDLTINRGVGDCWVLKLDDTGNIIWQKSFGGSDEDAATAIFQNSKGTYTVGGWTYSNDYDFKHSSQHGEGDIFIAILSPDNGNTTPVLTINKSLNVDEELQSKIDYQLRSYPNPISGFTTISYSLAQHMNVSLKILDHTGRIVRTWGNVAQSAGKHITKWNADDDRGKALAAGVYFLTIQAGSYSETKTLVVVK
jgi:flagellar hook capping protein FlgD